MTQVWAKNEITVTRQHVEMLIFLWHDVQMHRFMCICVELSFPLHLLLQLLSQSICARAKWAQTEPDLNSFFLCCCCCMRCTFTKFSSLDFFSFSYFIFSAFFQRLHRRSGKITFPFFMTTPSTRAKRIRVDAKAILLFLLSKNISFGHIANEKIEHRADPKMYSSYLFKM